MGVTQETRSSVTLRLSVTDRCDLRCRYCMPADGVPLVPRADLPSMEELASTAAWLVAHAGVTRVRLTGGEPLLRGGLVELVRALVATGGVREVSLTTNGSHLARFAPTLRAAGLARVNVSLDSLDPQRFAEVTRGGDVGAVVAGIKGALAAGLAPVKLNAVLRRSTWRQDVPELLDFAAMHGLEVRFIELMRTGPGAAWAQREFVAAGEVQQWLTAGHPSRSVDAVPGAPARRMLCRWRNQDQVVGWITPVSHRFCDSCDRLRLDARGDLHRCLMDSVALPLVRLLRAGSHDAGAVTRYLAAKYPPGVMESATPMAAIGG